MRSTTPSPQLLVSIDKAAGDRPIRNLELPAGRIGQIEHSYRLRRRLFIYYVWWLTSQPRAIHPPVGPPSEQPASFVA